jgi:hypothetical protein
MNEYLSWQMAQILLACSISGLAVGTGAYQIEQYYKYPQYKETNFYRATTYTGKGQFKCQTGCPQPIWNNN